MAIGWVGALKLIPWGTVLDAAPHIVKGAKSLIARTRAGAAVAPATSPAPEDSLPDSDKLANLDHRIIEMQKQIVELSAEQKSSAELIKLLAEQNAEVVKAIEVFRIRTRILVVACALLVVALAVLAYWIAIK